MHCLHQQKIECHVGTYRQAAEWIPGGALIITVAPDGFCVAETGIVLTCEPMAKGKTPAT